MSEKSAEVDGKPLALPERRAVTEQPSGQTDPVVIQSQKAVKSSSLEVARLAVHAARGLAWPLLLLGLVVAYRGELGSIVSTLTQKLNEANKVAVAGLSFEIQKQVREAGNPELAQTIGYLSAAAVEELLQAPPRGFATFNGIYSTKGYTIPTRKRIRGFEELEDNGLLASNVAAFLQLFATLPLTKEGEDERMVKFVLTRPLSKDEELRLTKLGLYELTEKGLKAKEAIVRAVGEQLR